MDGRRGGAGPTPGGKVQGLLAEFEHMGEPPQRSPVRPGIAKCSRMAAASAECNSSCIISGILLFDAVHAYASDPKSYAYPICVSTSALTQKGLMGYGAEGGLGLVAYRWHILAIKGRGAPLNL